MAKSIMVLLLDDEVIHNFKVKCTMDRAKYSHKAEEVFRAYLKED
jgi:hypothetical protein